MDITLTIPDHKFQEGDVVRYHTNGEDIHGFLIIGKIHAIVGGGEWHYVSPRKPIVQLENYCYSLTCQDGCLTTGGTPIRPGVFQTIPVKILDEVGEKVDYQGKDWTPDSAKNLMERWDNWKQEKHK